MVDGPGPVGEDLPEHRASAAPTPADVDSVRALLGRRPQGSFSVVVRAADGTPAVIENSPLMDSGRPMPTTYWLLSPPLRRWVGTLEAEGGVDDAETQIGLEAIAHDHERYRQLRDRALDAGATQSTTVHQPTSYSEASRAPRPSGGVGGTRVGVKCLHAHLAWWLVDGNDLVGGWTAQRLVERWTVPDLRLADGTPIRWPDPGADAHQPTGATEVTK